MGADGLIIDDLLTVKLSPKITWLKEGIGVGDAGLHPAEPLLEMFRKLGLQHFFAHFDLKSLATDGLENLHKIGGDGDGHEYVVGVRSQQFYAMWHGETAFEPVAGTTKEFLQWLGQLRDANHRRSLATGGCRLPRQSRAHRCRRARQKEKPDLDEGVQEALAGEARTT
jgi:hypothetical protein